MPWNVLLVDPHDGGWLSTLQRALEPVAEVEWCAEFHDARARVLTRAPDFLVTNLRLHDYNGLHLVLLAAGTGTRCIVYAAQDDFVLAREAQSLGAFYERLPRLPFALRSYLSATLPPRDRRTVAVLDRRIPFRGGRRCTDLSSLSGTLGALS